MAVMPNCAMQRTVTGKLRPPAPAAERDRWASQETPVHGDDYGSGSDSRRRC